MTTRCFPAYDRQDRQGPCQTVGGVQGTGEVEQTSVLTFSSAFCTLSVLFAIPSDVSSGLTVD